MATAVEPIEARNAPAAISLLIAHLVGDRYEEPLQACIPVGQQAMRDNFTASATPENVSWPARKDPGDGHPLLIDTGALIQAATGGGPGSLVWLGNQELEMGVLGEVIPYAATHNYGRGNIPAREFAGLHEVAEDECEDIIADYVLATIFGLE